MKEAGEASEEEEYRRGAGKVFSLGVVFFIIFLVLFVSQ